MTDKLQFTLKSSKVIIIDFLSVNSLLQHKQYLPEVAEQLEKEWKPAIRQNIRRSFNQFFGNIEVI